MPETETRWLAKIPPYYAAKTGTAVANITTNVCPAGIQQVVTHVGIFHTDNAGSHPLTIYLKRADAANVVPICNTQSVAQNYLICVPVLPIILFPNESFYCVAEDGALPAGKTLNCYYRYYNVFSEDEMPWLP